MAVDRFESASAYIHYIYNVLNCGLYNIGLTAWIFFYIMYAVLIK